MNRPLTWIGGATAIVVAAFGLASLGGTTMERAPTGFEPIAYAAAPGELDEAPTIDEVIPVASGAPGANAAQGEARMQPAAAAAEEFTIKRVLPIDGPIRYGDWYWDTKGVPEGPLVVTVDLQARVISVFRGGYEIGAAAAMLGTDAHPTPTGIFPILAKQRQNISEKYNNAPMPWSLFLTRDGVAIHGGSEVENGYASHGCIAIPDELASRLFAVASKGDRVIITDGKSAAVGDKLI